MFLISDFSMVSPELRERTNQWLHLHYLMCWFTIVLGYPALVASFLMNYYDSPYWVHVSKSIIFN